MGRGQRGGGAHEGGAQADTCAWVGSTTQEEAFTQPVFSHQGLMCHPHKWI